MDEAGRQQKGDPETIEEITRILGEGLAGADATAALLPLVYDELKVLAHRRLNREYDRNTLQTTGLVHEAYLKLIRRPDNVDWKSRNHFFAVASRAMRQVLVNRAHARKSAKRGGNVERINLDDAVPMSEERADELIALDEALDMLRHSRPRIAGIVDLRYFGGFSISECSEILDLSESTVNRDWRVARVWLFDYIKPESK